MWQRERPLERLCTVALPYQIKSCFVVSEHMKRIVKRVRTPLLSKI